MLQRIPSLMPILFLLLLSFSACSRPGGPTVAAPPSPGLSPNPGPVSSANFVKATTSEALIPAGGQGEAAVGLTIQSGYHINANPPTYPYLKATELTVAPGNGISVGFLTYPAAVTKKFSFADNPLAVYEGLSTIKVMLKAEPKAAKGSRLLAATMKVQACDDQVCYPPATINVSLPVTIK